MQTRLGGAKRDHESNKLQTTPRDACTTYADSKSWSAKLSKVAAIVKLDDEIVSDEKEAANTGQSRARVLLAALGRLYESSHLLIASF